MEIASTKSRGNPNWIGGKSGNPAGRPMASRQRLGEKLIADLADVWERRGAEVFERLANDDPATLAKLGVSVLPKELFLSVQQRLPANLTTDEWNRLVWLLSLPEKLGAKGTPDEIAARIERAVHAEFAAPVLAIEHAPALPPPPYR
jgi:hypothetical protein